MWVLWALIMAALWVPKECGFPFHPPGSPALTSHPLQVPEELFGPLSMRALEEDKYIRQTSGWVLLLLLPLQHAEYWVYGFDF